MAIRDTLVRLVAGSHSPQGNVSRYGRSRIATGLLLRALAVVFLIAFASLRAQLTGLVGEGGILPAARFMEAAAKFHPPAGPFGLFGERARVPTLAWFGTSDRFLEGLAEAGMATSLLPLLGILPGPAFLALWLLYLSLVTVGADFLAFQWDGLLLECGLLAAALAPWQVRAGPRHAPPPDRWLLAAFRLLLFQLMFQSGVVKLASGDPTWSSLAALEVHYQTQPLPSPLAWYVHQLPWWFHRLSVAVMFAIELVVPFWVLLPGTLRQHAFFPLVGLQVLIALTGNYGFFNLLSALLCLVCLDDAWLVRRFPGLRSWVGEPLTEREPVVKLVLARAVGAVFLLASLSHLASMAIGYPRLPGPLKSLLRTTSPLRSFPGYGLFAVMTTERREIEIQGSRDGKEWRTYRFRHKPGDPHRNPGWSAPHMPRLDWLMWFAALGDWRQSPWLFDLMGAMGEGRAPVLALFAEDPFPGDPPNYLRARIHRYRFSTRDEAAATGLTWVTEDLGAFGPVLQRR